MRPEVLLINPWIYDFAAFDLWARPLGLLYLSSWLEKAGASTRLVDCLDRSHPGSKARGPRPAWPPGTGQWLRTPVPTPKPLAGIPRQYSRYGLPEEVFRQEALKGPRPDLILVTSIMTYWYPGVVRAIEILREIHPHALVILGGVYATLCRDHALKNSGADLVVSGPGEDFLLKAVAEASAGRVNLSQPEAADWSGLWPNMDLYPRPASAPLMTSRGCSRRCPYCASGLLFDRFHRRDPEDALSEIEDRANRLGIKDFAFYDDDLLAGSETRLVPILEGVIRKNLGVRFHAPNGLHVGSITPDLARLMKKAGFETLRLGLETLDHRRQAAMGGKVPAGGFETAMRNLKAAGFDTSRIGAYILMGLPGQSMEEVLETAESVKAAGARPFLAEYSPLPGTGLWEEAIKASPFDLATEPLFHNNTYFPCRGRDFSWEKMWEIKRAAVG